MSSFESEAGIATIAVPPEMRATTVIFDIDETITYTAHRESGNGVMDVLTRLTRRSLNLSAQEAEDYILKNTDMDRPLDETLHLLDISEEEFGDAAAEVLSRSIKGYADAVNCVRVLADRGFRLLTGTTNSRFISRAKLRISGLLGPRGIAPFTSILGGAEVHPEGKSGPEFFMHLLQKNGLTPGEVVHVGDMPDIDLAYALEVGISQVVLPRRNQKEDWILESDGGLYVRSLEILPAYLEKI